MTDAIGQHGPAAVIDIGTTSIRMLVAEIQPDGQMHQIDALEQSMQLGSDSFSRGRIAQGTIDECITALQGFRRVIDEHHITDPRRIRAVTTSAVREAQNRDFFLDRIYSATGFTIEPVTEADVTRFTYVGLLTFTKKPFAGSGYTVIIEVGSGATEVIVLKNGKLSFARTFRFGSLRSREAFHDHSAPTDQYRDIITTQINQITEYLHQHIPTKSKPRVIVIGGEMRFVAEQLGYTVSTGSLAQIPLAEIEAFSKGILSATPDALVKRFRCSFQQADSFGPALISYLILARSLNAKKVGVCGISMREGILAEMLYDVWRGRVNDQIIHSAEALGKQYDVDQHHAQAVTRFALELFDFMQDEHHLRPQYRMILNVASLLHDIGMFISNRSHHKHAMYLIQNSDIFGMSGLQQELTAQVARYHRRALPKASHDHYVALPRTERIAVCKLSAILRVADALDRGHTQRISAVEFNTNDDSLLITARGTPDVAVEQLALEEKDKLFREVFGRGVRLLANP